MSQKRSEFRRILVEFVIRAADYRKTAISVNAAEWVTEYKVRGRFAVAGNSWLSQRAAIGYSLAGKRPQLALSEWFDSVRRSAQQQQFEYRRSDHDGSLDQIAVGAHFLSTNP